MLALPRNSVHLWWAECNESAPDAGVSCPDVFDDCERSRWADMARASRRARFGASRRLLRHVLSSYSPVADAAWRFTCDRHGRPTIHSPSPAGDLWFSLSRTRGLVACVVARDPRVGVDVECIDSRIDSKCIARRFFTATEAAALRQLGTNERTDRFFQLWTAKESLVKALGVGLAMPLNAFNVELDPPAITSTDAAIRAAAPWTLWVDRPTRHHVLAVSAARSDGAPWMLVRRHVQLHDCGLAAPTRLDRELHAQVSQTLEPTRYVE